MEIPDEFSPSQTSPSAVVRSRGESYDQLQLRRAGYGPEQYDASAAGRRNMVNPLERSYRIAMAREREERMKAQDLQEQANFERAQGLKELDYAMQKRIHEAAQSDKATALNEMGYFLDEQDQLAQQYGRGSREYMLSVLSASRKYPSAIMQNPRLAEQLNHYDKTLTNAGVSDEVKQAVSEIGQADATLPDMLSYLDTIPGKYPGIVNDPHIMGLFNTKRKEAAAAELRRSGVASGLQPDRITVDGTGGNETLTSPKGADQFKQASAVRGQIRTLEAQARDHRKAIAEIEKESPGWIGTTGIFTDKKGVRRYGHKDKPAEDSPAVTDESEEKFKRYQDAVRKRDEIEERVPQLNQQLDDLLNGTPAAKESPATEDGVPSGQPSSHSPNDTALKAMDDNLLKSARAAIAAGKDAKAVADRLRQTGYDPAGL